MSKPEKRLFDYMISEFLDTFYNAPAVRVRKIELKRAVDEEVNFENMLLIVNIQGTNKLGGTLFKGYMFLFNYDFNSTHFESDGSGWIQPGYVHEVLPELDHAKINAALEEYWSNNIYN